MSVLCGEKRSICKVRNIGEFCILEISEGADGSRGLAAGRLLAVFAVGDDVEGDEEDEVGCDYTHSCESCKLFSCALSCIWHPWEVGRREVGVGCEVDKACGIVLVGIFVGSGRLTEINDELHNLQSRDVFLPPDLDSTRALEVVVVHENVNHQVERNWDP
jgi:hypothetical protein